MDAFAAVQQFPLGVAMMELTYQRSDGISIVRSSNVTKESDVGIHAATPFRLCAQDRLKLSDPLEIIVQYRRAFLDPAMGLERICDDAEDYVRKQAAPGQEFKQR